MNGGGVWVWGWGEGSVDVRVLLGPVHGAKALHVLLDVLLGLVLDVLVALQVLGVVAGLQLLVHDPVGELRRAETPTHFPSAADR